MADLGVALDQSLSQPVLWAPASVVPASLPRAGGWPHFSDRAPKAEQWFETAADSNAVYGRAERPFRADMLAHISAFQRLVVQEHEQPQPAASPREGA